METVGNYPDLVSAQLAQSILEAEGIPTTIPDEHLAGLDWRLCGGIGGVRLQVPPEHAETAVALLASTSFDPEELDRQAELALHAAGDDPPLSDCDICPACGSEDVVSEPSQRRAKALTMLCAPVLLLVGPLLAARRKRLQCRSCNHIWLPKAGP